MGCCEQNLPILQKICCYYVLERYNLLTDSYHLIGLGYKFLLTLSVTQVACERSFSTLKFIKTRLRSTAEERLEAYVDGNRKRDWFLWTRITTLKG